MTFITKVGVSFIRSHEVWKLTALLTTITSPPPMIEDRPWDRGYCNSILLGIPLLYTICVLLADMKNTV